MFELFGLNQECRYRIRGVYRESGNERVIVFDLKDSEMIWEAEGTEPLNTEDPDFRPIIMPGRRKKIVGYPADWAEGFGDEYYRNRSKAREMEGQEISSQRIAVDEQELNVTSQEAIRTGISELMDEMKERRAEDDGTDSRGTGPNRSRDG